MGKVDQHFEKNKCSLDLLTHKTLTSGHPDLSGHYDERKAAPVIAKQLLLALKLPRGHQWAGWQLCQNMPTRGDNIALTPLL